MQTATTQTSRVAFETPLQRTLPGRLGLALAATLFVAAAAHISIPLWFTPVPLTLQPLAVLGVGLALGPVAGFFAMIAYLTEGVTGLPVFSPTGPGGLAQLLGPTGGFLMAYPLVALVAGGGTRWLRRILNPFAAASIACAVAVVWLFACGAGWLMCAAHVSVHRAWSAAVLPFLPGEAIKVLCAAGIYSAMVHPKR